MDSADLLADILRAQRLRGTVYFRADFREPWGLDIRSASVANFHIVAKGQCWLRSGAPESTRRLDEGDVVLFPRRHSHSLLHAPDGRTVPAERLIEQAPAAADGRRVLGGSGAVTTTLICGHFDYDRRDPHPLFETLPSIVHVRGSENGTAEWLATAARLAVAESEAARPGAGVVVDRLAEALLIQALAGFMTTMTESETRSFLAAVQDRCVGRALYLLHEDVARDWTLGQLAREAGVSRSVLTSRFRELVGESPMVYLARWRMLRARELLLETTLPIARVAEAVGYGSEFSFSKAFKRWVGVPPGVLRRRA